MALQKLPMDTLSVGSETYEIVDTVARAGVSEIESNAATYIPANSISSTQLEDSAVTTQKIADNAVVASKIMNAAVTEAKLDNDVVKYYKNDYVTPQMFGAKADGTTDDSTAIREAVHDSVLNGKRLVFPDGTYRLNSPIYLPDYNYASYYTKIRNWTMDAENADFVYAGSTDNTCAFIIRGMENCTLKFGKISCVNTTTGCIKFDASRYSYWSQYINIYFKEFDAGSAGKCVHAYQVPEDINSSNTDLHGGWINEIRWYQGRCKKGAYGFYLERTTPDHNMSHWDFHEIGFEGDSGTPLGTGVYLRSSNNGKVIGSFLFDNCRHEENFTKLIETSGPVTKMNFYTQASFPYNKVDVDSYATDWEIYCPLYDSFRIVDGEYVRIDRFYSLDGGIPLASGTDLHTILTPGNYFANSNDLAASMTNCPTNKAFTLKVEDKGGVSTHASANYRYLRYTLFDFDNIEYTCAASTSNAGSTWSFTNWDKHVNNVWTDVSNTLTYSSNTSDMTIDSSDKKIRVLYNAKLGLVNISGNFSVAVTQAGVYTIATLADAYKSKDYYVALATNYHIANDYDKLIYGAISTRNLIKVRIGNAFDGKIMIAGTYVVDF